MKNLLSFLGITLLSSTTLANSVTSDKMQVISDLDVKLGAYAAFESGFANQSNLEKSEKKMSANKEGLTFFNDAALYATISNKNDVFEYGGKIILVPTVKRKSIAHYNGSHVFVENSCGRIELGSPVPVAVNMMISDGGIPSKYIKTSSRHLKQGKSHAPSFQTGDGHFLGNNIVAELDDVKYSNEPPRTINYYTPSIPIGDTTKAQVGVSYTLDSANTGAGSLSDKSKADKKEIGNDDIHRFEINNSVTDAITAGIRLEKNFSDNIKCKIALTSEYGKTKGKAKKFATKDDKNPQEYKLANLRSYNVGGELRFSCFIFSVCYGNLGKSFTTPEFHKLGKRSHYYNAGVAYKYNATTTKLSYFASEQYKNKVNIVKVNVSHLLATGLKPYVEFSNYTLKGKQDFYTELKSKSTKGIVALLGIKLTL